VGESRFEATIALTVKLQLTAVRRFHTSDDLHQCRFSRTIPAHQGMNLTWEQRKIDTFQYTDAGKLFSDLVYFNQGYGAGHLASAYEQKNF